MSIGIDDLDFNDSDPTILERDLPYDDPYSRDDDGDPIKPWMSGVEPEPKEGQDGDLPDPNKTDPENLGIIELLLKEKNILDPSKIKFEDEEGNISERDWNSLSQEELLNILKTPTLDLESLLDEDEIGLINLLRLTLLSPEEFINAVKKQGALEYAQTLELGNETKIDDLSNDELFILDLLSRVEDITDEEAKVALERAKQDEALFNKLMKGIREEYRRIEEERNLINTLEQERLKNEEFEAFKDSVLDSILSLDKIGSLDIDMEEEDMNELANFILSSDSAGVNYLAKALDDPQTLVRMAWFALKGEEAIDSITQYFVEEIKKVSLSRYEEGLKDGKAGKQSKKTSTVVIQTPPEPKNISLFTPSKQLISIDDLD